MPPMLLAKLALSPAGQKCILGDLAKMAKTNPDIAKVLDLLGVDLNSRNGATSAFAAGKIDESTLSSLIESLGGEGGSGISSLLSEGGSGGLGGILSGLLGNGGGLLSTITSFLG